MKLTEANPYLDSIMTMLGMERQATGKLDIAKRNPRPDVEIEPAEWHGPKGKGWGAVFSVTDDTGRKWRNVRTGSGGGSGSGSGSGSGTAPPEPTPENPLGPNLWTDATPGTNPLGKVL